MRYKLFGRSGLRVSELCLGTGGFGFDGRTLGLAAEVGSDAQESRAIFDAFAEAGGISSIRPTSTGTAPAKNWWANSLKRIASAL